MPVKFSPKRVLNNLNKNKQASLKTCLLTPLSGRAWSGVNKKRVLWDLPKVFQHLNNRRIYFLFLLLISFDCFSLHNDSLMLRLSYLKEDTSKISLLNFISESTLKSGDFKQALHYGNQAKALTDSLLNTTEKKSRTFLVLKKYYGLILNQTGNIFFQQHLFPEALSNYKLAYQAMLVSGFETGVAVSLGNMGNVYNELADFKNASGCFTRAFSIYSSQNDKSGMAGSYNNLGNTAIYSGNYPEAMKNFLLSLKLRESINDIKGIASAYNNLGTVAYHMKNYGDALLNFRKSLAIKDSIGDRKGVANLYNAIGSVYGDMNQSENALLNFRNALTIHLEMTNMMSVAQIYNNMGVIYTADGKYKDALENFLLSLKIKEENNDKKGVANTLSNIAGNYFKQKNYQKALDYYQKSLALAIAINNRETIRENYLGLSDTYSATHEFEKAFAYQIQYTALKDSMLNTEKNTLIAEMKAQFETEKKDNEIKLLNTEKKLQETTIEKQKTRFKYIISAFSMLIALSLVSFLFYNQRRKTAFDRQVSEVEMTALRAQMNPHFIFNSLNSIYKYIQLKEPDQASEYLIKFSKLMRLILENSRFQEVSLEKDLHALALYMQLEAVRMNNRFTFEIITGEEIDPDITLVPPLILQPFVENAIWHGLQHKKEGGKIIIEINKQDNMLVCAVEDNGIGRKMANEIKEKSPNHKGESLGMKITNSRIEIINKIKKTNASVKIIDKQEGVRVEVNIPYELNF